MLFLEHLICNIKQGADILAGCMVLRGHAPDVCIKQILNFGHCIASMPDLRIDTSGLASYYDARPLVSILKSGIEAILCEIRPSITSGKVN